MSVPRLTFDFEQESEQKVERVSFKWTIVNFSYLDYPTGHCLQSRVFNNWMLQVYPQSEKDKYKNYLSCVFVHSGKGNEAGLTVNAKIQVSVLSPNGETLHSIGSDELCTFDSKNCWGARILRSVLLDKSNGYLTGDKLRLGVELLIRKEIEHGPLIPKKRIPDDHETLTKVQCAMSDYSEFMNSKELSDIEIVNQDGEKLKAHKVVLARNSTVFANAFKHPMKETTEGLVTIDKIRSEVLMQMLKFMYSGKLEEATKTNMELLSDLLAAADMYEIAQLKTICENLLWKNMTKENVIDLFELGETYRCSELMDAALELIGENENFVLETTKWKQFSVKKPQLANLVLSKLLNLKVNLKRKAGQKAKATSSTSTTAGNKRK